MTARFRYEILKGDDPRLAGNWYPFPPPDEAFYDLRKVESTPATGIQFQYYGNKRVYRGVGSRLHCMGIRVVRMSPGDGWQFRFQPKGFAQWRPMAIVYDLRDPGTPVVLERRDVTGQLPLARSIQEARYIVRLIPERWPIFRKIHVEYTEEKLQS